MKKAILLLIIFSSFTTILFAQTFNLRFVEITNNGTNGGNFDVKVQISGSATFKLGASNITFDYNTAGLNTPSLETAHTFLPPFYGSMTVTEPLSGVVSVNIPFSQTDEAFASAVAQSPGWTDVATVRFIIANKDQTSLLAFRSASPSPTVVFKVEGSAGTFQTTQLNAGTWNGLDNPLPVELSTFNVNTVEGSKAELSWETATEINNHGFSVERSVKSNGFEKSTENAQWEEVAFVRGHGNSNSPKFYSFTDENLVGGSKFMYRLKQIDIDGTFEYSDIIEIEVVPNKFELLQNYPNPFNPSTLIRFTLPEDTQLAINIYNLLGEKVVTILNDELKAGFHQVNFNTNSAGYNLASGIYIYTLESKNFSQVKKMVLMK